MFLIFKINNYFKTETASEDKVKLYYLNLIPIYYLLLCEINQYIYIYFV